MRSPYFPLSHLSSKLKPLKLKDLKYTESQLERVQKSQPRSVIGDEYPELWVMG